MKNAASATTDNGVNTLMKAATFPGENTPKRGRRAGSLSLIDADDALTFSAKISPELAEVSYVRDALAGLAAGLIAGISPGFRIPPERTVPNAESVAEEDPAGGTALIRTIHQAILFELSLVTRPAYSETEAEARNWQPMAGDHLTFGLHRTF